MAVSGIGASHPHSASERWMGHRSPYAVNLVWSQSSSASALFGRPFAFYDNLCCHSGRSRRASLPGADCVVGSNASGSPMQLNL